jgi:hypothetical protein
MVLTDLGARLHGALNQLSRASVVDDKVRYRARPDAVQAKLIS